MKQELEEALCDKYPVITGPYRKRPYRYIPFFRWRIRNNWLIKHTLRIMRIFNKDAYLPVFSPYDSRSPFAMFGFEVGDGWYDLIDRALNKLEPIAIAANKKYQAEFDCSFVLSQVKEKFGQLRVYTSFHEDDAQDVINDAESESAKICEVCGKPGRIVGKGWWSVRCTECSPNGN